MLTVAASPHLSAFPSYWITALSRVKITVSISLPHKSLPIPPQQQAYLVPFSSLACTLAQDTTHCPVDKGTLHRCVAFSLLCVAFSVLFSSGPSSVAPTFLLKNIQGHALASYNIVSPSPPKGGGQEVLLSLSYSVRWEWQPEHPLRRTTGLHL